MVRKQSWCWLLVETSLTLKQIQRRRIFTSYWMTSDANFETLKRIETEIARKQELKRERESNQ